VKQQESAATALKLKELEDKLEHQEQQHQLQLQQLQ
jgi:hypothetical protein